MWDDVTDSFNNFAMAMGNRGHCLSWYARYLYDPGHQNIFLNESYHQIKKALDIGVEEHASDGMNDWLRHLSSIADWDKFDFVPNEESRGESKAEREYRSWCIEKRLFLNPLSDIWKKDIVANDVLTFPSVFLSAKESSPLVPEVYGIYNQLKQEYISARYIMFEAIEESGNNLHFSDKRVKLYDMLDYRIYRLWIEKLKMAFLAAYAIFDKVAYLVNEYWKLSINIERIKFNTVWYKSTDSKRKLNEKFSSSQNWPLRGLFWVSKDLFYKKSENHLIEPDARQLNHIRNHIAHKYLRVYDEWLVDARKSRENDGHHVSYSIGHEEFILQSIRLLKLVRSALIYLSLAAHAEESKSMESISKDLIGEMELHEINDSHRL